MSKEEGAPLRDTNCPCEQYEKAGAGSTKASRRKNKLRWRVALWLLQIRSKSHLPQRYCAHMPKPEVGDHAFLAMSKPENNTRGSEEPLVLHHQLFQYCSSPNK